MRLSSYGPLLHLWSDKSSDATKFGVLGLSLHRLLAFRDEPAQQSALLRSSRASRRRRSLKGGNRQCGVVEGHGITREIMLVRTPAFTVALRLIRASLRSIARCGLHPARTAFLRAGFPRLHLPVATPLCRRAATP